ncbi:MAG: hypothetical protein NTW37_11720 [Proteobacteria bacterium]|nr:hypothetical protein [Pseudomonadota bacterium]
MPSSAPGSVQRATGQWRPRLVRQLPPRTMATTPVTMFGTTVTTIAVRISMSIASIGVAITGKPNPIAPCSRPASATTANTAAHSSSESSTFKEVPTRP